MFIPQPDAFRPLEQDSGIQDRRATADTRLVTTLLVGRLVTARGDVVCRVRNISANGARIECAIPLGRGEKVQLELRGAELLEAEVAWAQGGATGLHFHSPVPSELILKPEPKHRGWHNRLPRLETECAVLVTCNGRRIAATLRDINQRGMRIDELSTALTDGTLSVHVSELGTMNAGLRWQREGAAGLQFVTPIRFEILSAWLVDPARRFARRA
ncbi:PilZ domain-containing protein [Sphingomonas sp. ST-64]|uniref:PilZ domain-containing protein n=1 Tax=Sphingomonas plantiphila TaxID=3163295 RepID=A0ABW8YNR8_9SPHN